MTTDFNVLIDGRVGEKAEIELTARLANVALDMAVGFFVDMAGLGVVRKDYVTSIENAAKRQAEQTK